MGFAASNDTIVAVSSAVGAAARMIVRASGNDALALARAVIESSPDAPGGLLRCRLRVRDMSVPATVYAFVGPRSYTGEDLVEFHVPGNPLLARLLLEDLLGQGARLAEPGEFTARAYFNGRLDLSAAEGVAAAVSAQNEQELRAARQLMSGELARRLRPAMDLLAETLGLVEVGIDFSDEDVTVLAADALRARIETVDAMLSDLLSTSARFERMAHEVQIVLVGRPNAGKSTLLNALAGVERAVVSPVAGTTRDAVSADVPLPRGIVRMIDVAGLQEHDAPPAEDASPQAQIARAMQQRALEALERADAVVLVREANDRRPPLALPRPADLLVMSKLDEAGDAARSPAEAGEANWQAVSALTGERMDALRQRLDELAFGADAHQPALALNARHLDAIGEARHALARCGQHVSAGAGAEILALELREALDALGTILGQVTPDDVLGRIFATFCIGK